MQLDTLLSQTTRPATSPVNTDELARERAPSLASPVTYERECRKGRRGSELTPGARSRAFAAEDPPADLMGDAEFAEILARRPPSRGRTLEPLDAPGGVGFRGRVPRPISLERWLRLDDESTPVEA